MSKKYEYFISYSYDRGFGSASVTLEQKIDNFELLTKIAKMITKDSNFKSEVVILNFMLLREIGEENV